VLLLLLFKLMLVNHLGLDLHLELLLVSEGLQLRLSPLVLNSIHVCDVALKLLTELVKLNLVYEQPEFYHF
jgi:hypothetical protein